MIKDYKSIKCVGCGKNAEEIGEYDKDDNPVEEDGTYSNGNFVCTDCYIKLIPLGLDVGSPEQIQRRIIKISQ